MPVNLDRHDALNIVLGLVAATLFLFFVITKKNESFVSTDPVSDQALQASLDADQMGNSGEFNTEPTINVGGQQGTAINVERDPCINPANGIRYQNCINENGRAVKADLSVVSGGQMGTSDTAAGQAGTAINVQRDPCINPVTGMREPNCVNGVIQGQPTQPGDIMISQPAKDIMISQPVERPLAPGYVRHRIPSTGGFMDCKANQILRKFPPAGNVPRCMANNIITRKYGRVT
jgi:hypothetical protein